MKISVVTVCYNSSLTIRDTIESVLSQDYPDIEYIIVDGGSSDQTMKIVGEYGDSISCVISEPDQGIYDAMNKGIKAASGDVVGILNSDDIFSGCRVLSEIVSAFLEFPEADGVYGDLVYVDRLDTSKIVRVYSSRFFSRWKLRFGFMLPHPTLYLRKRILMAAGEYKVDYRVAADFEYILRLHTLLHCNLRRIPKMLIRMRIGGASNSGLKGQINQNFEIVRACRENGVKTSILLLCLKVPFKLFGYFRIHTCA